MGDPRRFRRFADLIERNFPPARFPTVADVAGGKGALQGELRRRGYDVTTFDKRKGRKNRPGRMQYCYSYFTRWAKPGGIARISFADDPAQATPGSGPTKDFDLLVGMHPDGATDVIIDEAARRRVPFVICPCCVITTVTTLQGEVTYAKWLAHLERFAHQKGFKTQRTVLSMKGKNFVLLGSPR